MTNPFLISSIEDQQAQPPANANPFALQAIQNDQRQDLRNTLTGAVRENPDAAAEAARLAKRYPAPVDVLARNLQDVKLQEMVDKADETLQTSPKLAEYLRTKPWTTQQSHDDIPPLSAVERVFNVARSVPAGAARGLGGIASGTGELLDIGARATGLSTLSRLVREATGIDPNVALDVAGSFKVLGKGGKAIADAIGVDPANRNFATDVGEGIGQLLQQIGVQIATGGTASLVTLFAQGADAMATKTEKDNASQAIRDTAVLTGASITALTEKYGVDALLNRVPPKIKNDALRWVADKLIAGGIEATQEITEGVLQDLVRVALTNPDAEVGEGLVYEAGVAGTAAAIVRAALGVRVRSNVEVQRANEAQQHAQKLQEAMTVAAQSKLRERNPETFRDLAASLTDNTVVYVDAQVLAQSATELAEALPAVAEQLEDALASNSTVEVSIADILTLAPGTPLEQVFLQNARQAPDALSLADADQAGKQAEQFLAQEAERVLQQAADTEVWQQSSEQVKQAVLTQLNSTGRFTPDVNDAYATLQANFFSTMAARVGMTPQELYDRYALKVAAQPVGQGGVLNDEFDQAGQLVTDTPNFKNWFGNSKVVDERGAPLVVYHGTVSDVDAFDPNAQPYTYESDRGKQFFLDNPQGASDYAIGTSDAYGGNANVMPVYITMQNPRIEEVDGSPSEWWDEQGPLFWQIDVEGEGHDGAIIRGDGETMYVTGNPTQIKSVFNRGAFSPTDPNVLNQAAVERLTSAAERGERITGTRAVISPEEKQAIKESADKVGISEKEITRVVREHKLAHPPAQGWAPLVFNRVVIDDGKVTYEYQKTPYDFSADKNGKQLEPGSPEYKRRVNAVARGMTDEVRRVFVRANAGDKNAENILAQAGWYKSMRSRLRQEFGGLGDLFADLLGATSPNTPVRDNWTNAVDSLRRASRGDFDALFPQWEAWSDNVDNLENTFRAWFNDRVAEGLTKKAIKALPEYKTQLDALKEARKLPDNLLPTKESGKKYGFNGRNVARAMVDLWRVVKNADPDIARGGTAPKALNFSGNLIGFRERATIDVWAARMLQRLGGGQRIASMAETGVSGEMREDATTTLQFGFGQDVFTEAVKRIRADQELKTNKTLANINDDDLQAVVWFVEKELWTVNNWTNAAGEGGSFELEANLSGSVDQARIKELRRILDSSKSKPDAKAQAREELAALERTVDRFVGGLSIQMSADTQGLDFVPTDADMARLAEQVRTAVYEADDGNTVLASKTLSTQGRYGAPERALDLEVVAREGYNPNALWLEMLRQAQATRQDSTFLSRVLRDNETPDPLRHRPGVEIYFREAAAQEQLEQVLADLAKEGVEFLTVIVDGRRMSAGTAGEMPPAVGVRLQYVPEFEQRYGMDDFSQLDDLAIAAKMAQKADELDRLAARVSAAVDGVSFAGQFWYDTQTAFSTEYQEKIDALTIGTAEGESAQAGGGVWSGQPIRVGVESADRQTREATGGQPDADLLGGNALSATDGQQPDTLNQEPLAQGPRGTFSPSQLLLTLNENADLSTFLHESGHFFLEVMADLASQTNTPQQIKDDMAATLQWFGVPDLPTWNSYTLDEKRPYHERWAESFEQYLFEGKAPSPELQPLFRRFRSWLVNVYKSLTQFMRARDLKLNDEVRQVFDRLVATDEQIAQAEEAAGMLPDFDATNEAIEQLQARSLRDLKWTINARSKYIKNLTKEAKELRKGVEAEVRAEVEAQPLYRAMNWLKKGETIDPETGDLIKAEKGYRLSTAALAEMYPESMLGRPDLTRLKGMTAKEGLPPDTVADMFGYETGDQLVRSIVDAEPIASVIEGMTDQRMLERHGDLATPEAREAAANEAVHNEARAKSLATELKSQAEMLNPRQDTGRTASNGRAITVNAITAAAKQFAENLAARRRLKDLKNAAWQHRSAEARAGKRWQEATSKGQTQEAVQAKRDQVLNNAAVKALQDAQAEVKKILEFFKRVTKGTDEKLVERGRDPDVVNAMRAILGAYDVAPRLEKSALAYMETVSRNDPQMYAALKPSVDGALLNAKPLVEMTMEELRGLNDELRAMWTLAKSSRQMEVDGNKLDIEDAADMLVARMEEIGIPAEIPGERGAITDKQERGIKLRFAKALLSRVEQWAERLDGTFGGPFLRLVFQPVKDAADRYRTDKVSYRKKFTALLQNLAPSLPAGPIDAPELGYTFGNARDSGTAELLHAILHTGNDSNKRKLLLGRGWATQDAEGNLDTGRWDAFIERMQAEGKINKAHYDFAQGVWDLLEEMKPLAQETHRKVFGRYFAEITANEVVTPFGTYRGGYVPAQTDSRLVKDAKLRELAEGENESMAYAFPASPSGFTKSRVEYNQPLLLDIRALAQHMDKVLLFSHMQGAVSDVRRLLTNKRVSYALDRIDPAAYEGMLIPWLNRAAKQIVETPVVGDRGMSRILSAARSRAGMALMFANLSNTFQQITGFSGAAVKVKPGLMMSSAATFIADPKAMKTTVAEASPYMKDRMLNEVGAMNDAVEAILIDPTLLERGQAWTQRHAYFLQATVDNTMSPIIWTAAYNQSIEQGMTERDAVRFADGVIRQTQGTTLPEDISRFESGPGYARLFTQFVSYFNMMANTNATAMKQISDEMGLRKGAGKLVYVALMGLLVPIWVAEAIAQAFRGGPEDEDKDGWIDDWLKAVFGFGTVKGLVAQVPIAGQAAQLVVNRFNDNPADDKFSLSPAVSLIESSVSAPASVYDAIVNDGNKQKAVRDVAAAATMLTGLPIYGVARPLGYLAGIGGGNIEPTGPADLARGLVTGTASPESKQR